MKITSFRMVLQDRDTRFVGLCTIVIDGIFMINSIKVLTSPKGFFLGMPSYTTKDGKHHDIAHPLNHDARTALENLVIEAYNHCVTNRMNVAWFMLNDSFEGSLTEQQFSDFCVGRSYNASEDTFVGSKHERNSNETFKNWLNS